MHEKLNSEFGIALMWPPYRQGNERVRGTSTFQPGAKENGGIFCHANPWAIIAAAMLGWGDRAFQYYRQILPLKREDADRFMVEPYVYCQNICGPEHPQFRLGTERVAHRRRLLDLRCRYAVDSRYPPQL